MKRAFLRITAALLSVALLLVVHAAPISALAAGSKLSAELLAYLEPLAEDELVDVWIWLGSASEETIESLTAERMPAGFTLDEDTILDDSLMELYLQTRREVVRELNAAIREEFLQSPFFTEDCVLLYSEFGSVVIASVPKAVILSFEDCELVKSVSLDDKLTPYPNEDPLPPVPTPGFELPFTDVSASSYYYLPVYWALTSKPQITNGTGAATFSPDSPCTRAEALTFLWRGAGCPEPKLENATGFLDVAPDAYYYKAVLWAQQSKITTGTSEQYFSPGKTCSRGEIVTFLWRGMNSTIVQTEECTFTDIDGAYFTQAVLWASEAGIAKGVSDTTFAPAAPCTRAQALTFLYRLHLGATQELPTLPD